MSFIPFLTLAVMAALIPQTDSAPHLGSGTETHQTKVTKTEVVAGVILYSLSSENAPQMLSLSSELIAKDIAHTLKQNAQFFIDSSTSRSDLRVKLEKAGEFGNKQFDLGYRVFIEGFQSHTDAKSFKNKITTLDMDFDIVSTSFLPGNMANHHLSILEVKPATFNGKAQTKLANTQIRGTRTVSEMAAGHSAIAAINGGYFSYSETLGIVGDPAGISVIDGELISEPVAHRPALLIDNDPRVRFEVLTDVTAAITLETESQRLRVDGLNRASGKVFNCGFYRDNALVVASHDTVCERTEEILVYTPVFGKLDAKQFNQGHAVHINAHGMVAPLDGLTGATLPPDHVLVVATGAKKTRLQALLQAEQPITLRSVIYNKGSPVSLNQHVSVINGGPTLVLDGRIPFEKWAAQGWSPVNSGAGSLTEDEQDNLSSHRKENARASFFDEWVNRRHPRTAVGITPDGTTYLVVVYGRNSEKAAGATLYELSQLFLTLGVTQAINLDGGGSSMMLAQGTATGIPSDVKGERAVADALLLLSHKE